MPESSGLKMQGRVTKSTGARYWVLGEDQSVYLCRIRGKFRLKKTYQSNPIVVGDRVVFDPNDEGNITALIPRNNFIERKSVRKSNYSNVLAANIDQIMILASLKQPKTSLGFIDRVLITAESFRIAQVLLFNKKDLLSPEERKKQSQLKSLYTPIGIHVEEVSMAYDTNLSPITEILHEKITLIVGHSGVGKSTLLNRLLPGVNQKTEKVSDSSKRGIHTTTYAEMFQIYKNTFVIDTPGVKEWGMINMSPHEISDYFPEMRDRRLYCKYKARCTHTNEPGCAILHALENGSLSSSRYKSYFSIITGKNNRA